MLALAGNLLKIRRRGKC